ncbi:hypothetical protein F4803DRAFT_547606 [Xylaria telfairii]|nr:hypothetical protein F4803DRAFT_547606 [Xylaria telfairii]
MDLEDDAGVEKMLDIAQSTVPAILDDHPHFSRRWVESALMKAKREGCPLRAETREIIDVILRTVSDDSSTDNSTMDDSNTDYSTSTDSSIDYFQIIEPFNEPSEWSAGTPSTDPETTEASPSPSSS